MRSREVCNLVLSWACSIFQDSTSTGIPPVIAKTHHRNSEHPQRLMQMTNWQSHFSYARAAQCLAQQTAIDDLVKCVSSLNKWTCEELWFTYEFVCSSNDWKLLITKLRTTNTFVANLPAINLMFKEIIQKIPRTHWERLPTIIPHKSITCYSGTKGASHRLMP